MFSRLRTIWIRLRDLPIQAYYTLSGWRFDDLKRHMDGSSLRNEDEILAMAEVGALCERRTERARYAIVTCLPPDESGIAIFSMRHLLAAQEPVDVFSQVREVSVFLANRTALSRRTGGRVWLNPMSSLLALSEINGYEAVVFVLGNSDHNVEVLRLLTHFCGQGSPEKAVAYMHDPCCHNALRQANRMTLEDYLHFLGNRYEVSLADLLGRETHRAVQEVVDRGILGVRGITSLGVARFVVNSRQAAELVRKDAAAPGLDIAVLYHPVFDREAGIDDLRARRQTGEEYVVGSFGGANRGKMTDVVVEAVQRLRAQGDKVRLVLAGYEARRFVRLNFGSTPEWITVSEPATERELQSEMAKCDLAIQLRHRNLGESSGVVPMLIGMGIPTVVSPIGAFLDYGDAVVRFGGDDPAELAALIASHPTVPQRRMATFAAEHGLDKFEEAVRHAALGAPAQDAVRRVAG